MPFLYSKFPRVDDKPSTWSKRQFPRENREVFFSARETAIRAAVGADRVTILRTAVSDGIAVLACGVIVGVPLAAAAMRPLTDILPDGVNPWSIGMFAAVGLVLLAVGAGAAWLPARQAANVNPARAL